MRVIVIVLLVLGAALAGPAQAGAWLRESGSTFSSTGFTLNAYRETTASSYLAHGLRDDLTIGVDVHNFVDRDGRQGGAATLFLRRPLGRGEGRNVWSYELGAGAAWRGYVVSPHLKGGVSWGRGYQLGDRNGWMNVDASVFVAIGDGTHLAKVDGTVGLELTQTIKGMMQLFVTGTEFGTYATVAPSLVFTPRGRSFSIQLGAESPLEDSAFTSIKVGLWRRF